MPPNQTTWTLITSEDLQKEIDTGISKVSPRERVLWRFLRAMPQKWALSPWGDEGGGLSVVTLGGDTCIYYNNKWPTGAAANPAIALWLQSKCLAGRVAELAS